MKREIEMMEALDYELRSSWWASLIFWDWGQEMAGSYFAWKVKRKHRRYIQSKTFEAKIKRSNK